MPRYKVGPVRLYINKRYHEPDTTFSTAEPLPNEALLVSAGSVTVLPDPKPEPVKAKKDDG